MHDPLPAKDRLSRCEIIADVGLGREDVSSSVKIATEKEIYATPLETQNTLIP